MIFQNNQLKKSKALYYQCFFKQFLQYNLDLNSNKIRNIEYKKSQDFLTENFSDKIKRNVCLKLFLC